jgi:hypothetical protein
VPAPHPASGRHLHPTIQSNPHFAEALLRKQIAAESLALHNRSIEQAEEIFELYKSKFSNLGLYTQLAGSLQRLHREAYNGAYAMARLAEQALRFERGDDVGATIGTGYWDASRAGLLAGERLNADLMALERRFLETNYRGLEIDQPFSLTQIDPAALVQLRQTGECTFEVPEVMFDLFYPGHYRRRIRAVRLTIPTITGPYVNVSATLTLLDSRIRPEPQLGAANLQDVPRRRSVSIATSTAQSDSGVFDMSFRDERYMPFEGQGAISRWQLTLPKTFRQFDYQTINDVIVTISYTAEQDGVFRQEVERQNSTVEGAIYQYLRTNSIGRLFSLRQDFSGAFHRLLHSPVNTPVNIEITERYFPAFLTSMPAGGDAGRPRAAAPQQPGRRRRCLLPEEHAPHVVHLAAESRRPSRDQPRDGLLYRDHRRTRTPGDRRRSAGARQPRSRRPVGTG